jgi:cobalt-zinc-cadmium efflux system outer membrane protein
LVFAERDLSLARETSVILRRFVDLNAERVKVGEAPGVELNLAKIELARSQRNEQEFERRYRGATASLNLLMGRPPAVSVIPTSDFAAPLSLPPDDELLDYGLQHRPEVLAADSNVEARTNAVRLARALRFPNLTLGAGYQQQNSIIGESSAAGQASQILRRDEQLAFQATLPLPLFSRNQGNVASADYERRAAEETARYVRNVVENEISIALANYRSRVLTRTLYEESVLPQLQRNIDAIQESYRLGNENIFAVIQVQRTFFDTRHEYIQTLLDLELDRIDLERATGRPLR